MSAQNWKHLQPLRIPPGWTVLLNKLEDAEPEDLPPEDPIWLFSFTEDILQLRRDRTRRRNKRPETQSLIIDLGWYPDGEPDGGFRLAAILDNDWANPLLTYETRSRADVVNVMEQWMFQEFMTPLFIDGESFRRSCARRKH